MIHNWLYEGEFQENSFGFVYKITNLTNGKIYIGKKSFIHNKRKKLGKKELLNLPVTRGRKPTSIIEQIDSGWKTYWGSSKELLNDVKTLGEDKFEKRILCFCNTKKQLSYYELEYQFKYKVLFIDSYNENINGSYFRKDFEISK